MDAEAKKKVHQLTRASVQLATRPLLMPWREFLSFAERQVAAYNARPHRSLPRITDAGGARNMSPDEAYAAWLERGWAPERLAEADAVDLFRPAREATTRRGEVVLFGNIYFNRDLEHLTGERVIVAYDIHDPRRVWIRDHDGRLLCEAMLDGNKRGFFPKSVIDQAREQRAAGRARRLAIQLDEVRAELGPLVIEGTSQELDAETEALAAEKLAALAPPAPANDAAPIDPQSSERPVFRSDEDFARWCLAHDADLTDRDRQYLAELLQSASFRRLIGIAADEANRA
jgi:putative transposase